MPSTIRHTTLPVYATILVRMYEVSAISIRELRALMVRADAEAGLGAA